MFHRSRSTQLGTRYLLALVLAGAPRLASAQEDIWQAPLAAEAEEQPADDEEPADDGGDITESIITGEITATEEAPEEGVEAAPPRVQLSGYARESLELIYGELARQNRNPGVTPLWRDVFISRSQLVLRASYVRERSFEATVSGVFGYALHVAEEAPQYSVGVVDLTRGDLESELREAYLGFFWPAVDLRIGQQRIAWGRSDFQSPNDVLNARDLRDPLLAEAELRHLPTFAVRSAFSSGAVTFEVVATPLFVPDRYDVYGSPWSIIQPRAPFPYQQFLGSTSLLVDPTMDRELADLWRHSERPPHNGKGASAGARLAVTFSGADLNLYYHYGYDSTPFVRLDPTFQAYLFNPETSLAIETPSATKLTPVLELIDGGVRPVTARYLRRHHVGMDLATTFGPIVARIDAAFETRRNFYAVDLNSFSSPVAMGVLGLEYQTGNLDEVVLLELLGTRMLKSPEELRLLGYEQTTATLAGTLRWGLSEHWGIDLRGAFGIQPRSYVAQPALRYKSGDSFSVKLGAALVSGATDSFGWYYSDNDTAFLQLKYSF